MQNDATMPMLEREPLLLLMDGHALIFRAFHAIRDPMTSPRTGEDTRGTHGFLNTFLKTLSDLQPTHVIATFDFSEHTFRTEADPNYKGHRPDAPEELKPQFDRVRSLMRAFNVPVMEMDGFEADDVLGTLCRQAEEQSVNTIVLTGDSDILQLVSPNVSVLLNRPRGGPMLYDVDAVRKRYDGLGPESVAEIKALQGDTSDNIKGVPGIGIKTAIKLLTEFGDIDGIYDHLDEVRPPRAKKSLTENREVAELARFLTTIKRDMDIELDMDAARFGDFDRSEVDSLLDELGFNNIRRRIPAPAGQAAQGALELESRAPTGDYTIIDTPEKLAELVSAIDTPDGFSFDTETTDQDPMKARLVGLSFSVEPGAAWYVPVGHAEGAQPPMAEALDALRPALSNPDVPKAAHNANYDIMVLENHGVKVEGLAFDTMLAPALMGRQQSQLGLKRMTLDAYGVEMTEITELIGRGRNQKTMAEVEIDKAADYAAADADFTERLRRDLSTEIADLGLDDVMCRYELPLVPVLVRMQRDGVAVDVDLLKRLSKELGADLDDIRNEMYETVGHEFNLNSPQQLGGVLFDELQLPTTRKTRTGNFSTDQSALEWLRGQLDSGTLENADPRSYAVLDNILHHRQLSKIKSTYVDALPNLVNENTGRIHTKYNQTGSATGRISSNDPNVQNIPVRTELGRRVRRAFVAQDAPESTLLAADYSQIELRVMAHYSKDPSLLEAFHRGEDIHSATSSLVYDVPIGEVTPEMRRIAKILNFGVLYGLTPHGIAQQTDLDQKQGKRFMDIYFENYPNIRSYVDDTIQRCRDLGYVETMLGRRRYLPAIKGRNYVARQAAERAAVNMPIQGTAADIIKIAMIRIMDRMLDLEMKSKMILQVHDELIFEVPTDELDQMRALVAELMPTSLELAVPLSVELKSGDNWGDLG